MTPEERAQAAVKVVAAKAYHATSYFPFVLARKTVGDAITAAVEAEREVCAGLLDERAEKIGLCGRDTIHAIAAAIRARSKS